MSQINQTELYERLKNALNELEKLRRQVHKLELHQYEPIAVIGMACELPGDIHSLEAFWQALTNADDKISPLPDDRWAIEEFVDPIPQTPGKMISAQGGFLRNHKKFDANFFGISPREAISMDPQQRLVLKVSWRALEHAGISPDEIIGTNTGVFVGVTNTDYAHAMLKQGRVDNVDAYSATGNALNVIAGRLSYFLNTHGPSVVVDTACSSSLVALHNACQSLRLEECNMAFCSGVNVILLPEGNIALSQANMLSPDGKCYTFDARANGYVRSEGCISFVLKRVSDAKRDGDKIYGLIRSSAINHGGKSSGLTVPNAKAQENLIRQAIKTANLEAPNIDYIEAHGTGTALGDPIEVSALNAVFQNSHDDEKPLLIGSVKSNFGHLESASGLLGLLKVLMAMQHGLIPANRNFSTLNPMINLNVIPARIVTQNTLWEGEKTAGVSSFGFSGINAHLIVSSPPAAENKQEALITRTDEVICCSAKDKDALTMAIQELKQFILVNPQLPLTTVAYNYNVCRTHFVFRKAFVAQSLTDLIPKLGNYNQDISAVNITKRKKVAFLISGQGSQYAGMGKFLYQTSRTFKQLIDKGCEKINPLLGVSLQDIMFSDIENKINQTLYTQPVLYLFNYALAKLWEEWGIEADCYIGHSIGEYVAATLAGVMDFDDALFLIYERARLMQGLEEGGSMTLVMASKEELQPILQASSLAVDIAIITNDYTVLSGKREDLDQLCKRFSFHVKQLDVSHAFHSSLMEPIREDFTLIAQNIQYKTPQKEVISNLTGEFYTPTTVSAKYWAMHLREAVDLRKSMKSLSQQKYDVLLEIGPRPTFSKSSNQFDGLIWLYSLRRGADDWQSMLMNLAKLYEAGMNIHWNKVYEGFAHEKIGIPGYPFQEKDFWGLATQNHVSSSVRFENCLYRLENISKEKSVAELKPIAEPTLLFTNDKTLTTRMKGIFENLIICADLDAFKKQIVIVSPKHIVFFMKPGKKELSLEIHQQYQAFIEMMKHLLEYPIQGNIVWLITNKGSQPELIQSPLLGLRKCLLLESRAIDCVHLAMEVKTWDEKAARQLALEISHPDEEKQVIYENNGRRVPRLKRCELNQYRPKANGIRDDVAYLITGGQGDLAGEIVNWYVSQGAKHIFLLSRRNATAKTKQQMAACATLGCKVECIAMDVSSKAALSQLLAKFGKTLLPLHGIIHAAGVVDDAVIQNQTWERFEPLLKSKILGAWYLHQLSLAHPLDHFILFSSMASVFGTHGQGNYAAANSFLDSLAAFRQHQNLPGLSINWGPWSEIGMAKDIISRAEGLHKLSPSLGMALFDRLMKYELPSQVVAADIDWKKTLEQHRIKIPFLDDFWLQSKQKNSQKIIGVLDIATLSTMKAPALKEKLITLLQAQFQEILRLDDPLRLTQNFFEHGMDSLMAIELRNNLQALFNHKIHLSQTLLFEISTLQDLAEYLVHLILKNDNLIHDDTLLSVEEKLLSDLDEMDEDDIDELLREISSDGKTS